jgi:hypothetical protein
MQLTNDDVAALMTEFRGQADDLLARGTRQVPPILIVVGEDGKRIRIDLQTDDPNGGDRKPPCMHAVAQAVVRQRIVPAAVVMVSQALIAPEEWSDNLADCPALEEGVFVGVAAADLRTLNAMLPVGRDSQNNMVAKDWTPTRSRKNPLLEEFYFGYDAVVLGGGFNN